MFGQEKLQELLNVTPITTNLSTFNAGGIDYPMLVNANVMPDAWGPQSSTINYYFSFQINGAIEYHDVEYYINCRAPTEQQAQLIALSVFEELNRATLDGYNITCNIFPVVRPADETDNYNVIIQARMKTNGSIN